MSNVDAIRCIEWMDGYDKGMSSNTIAMIMAGVRPRCISHPHDPSDFGRCYRLLKKYPDWKDRMSEVADLSDVWARLVKSWDEIEVRFLAEVAEETGIAPKTYELMRSIIYDGAPQ